jgi:indolepyruvate ferredoxin oxidoreductase
MALAAVSLDDKYVLDSGRIYLTGSQALVRLPILQRQRDLAAGLNTAGFIAGYRGSPMHALDQQLWRAPKVIAENHIHFLPAVNEDLAATSIWGSQQVGLFGDAKYDGVFALWYGKGPGLDRSVDAIRHANLAGTSKHGGVLALAGDDHGMRSSDVPAHCEPTFEDLSMPVLYPANVQEVLDLGLYGIAMSRFSGAWVGFKMVFETVDTSVSVDADHSRIRIVTPEFDFPRGGPHIRLPDTWSLHERRLREVKLPAALAFARANGLNRVTLESPKPRFGIVAAGKGWLDVRQALRELGLDDRTAADLGITVLKVGMPFPQDLDAYRAFADGLEEVLVVEEKREQIERAVKDACYALPEGRRPRITGRHDEEGRQQLDPVGELSPEAVTRVLARRIARFHDSERIAARLAFLDAQAKRSAGLPAIGLARLPYFCSGCPHNTSTKVPEGSRGQGGVGCHFMSTYMDRNVSTHTHMGGEGATWLGQSPFVTTEHVFQNMGDGTYFHSGLLAIRAAASAKARITYKILFNDAVAMTGGQPVDGPITVPAITHQVASEGVGRIAVVSDEPEKYPVGTDFAPGVTIHHRNALDQVQRDLREWPGTSVMIYDQTCAAEKRRRRKRGKFPDPDKRVFINDRVCEGCGDCNEKSNCLSVIPIQTEFGRKRTIDQSSCNKDFSCLNGFCPSFVTVRGGRPRKGRGVGAAPESLRDLPGPTVPTVPEDDTYGILVTGVGGTGVVTIGALLGMAAHLEGKGVSIVDQLGMAQKGGSVVSHVRFGRSPEDIRAVRLNAGNADLLLGCDNLVSGGDDVLSTVLPGRTRAVINSHESITGDFTRNPDLIFPTDTLEARIAETVGRDACEFFDATTLATRLLGDSIASNLFVVGYAWQKGLLPVSDEAILRAIELNGVAIDWNKEAFLWGRRAAHDMKAVQELAAPAEVSPSRKLSESLDEMIERRTADLADYQNAAYAWRYRDLVERARAVEQSKAKGMTGLAEAVARYAYKLMAYKDEYEVARLYADPQFRRKLGEAFEGGYKLEFNLAPPIMAPRDKDTGELTKMAFGSWMLPAFGLLAKLRFLRGSALDPFGKTAERREERALIAEYEATVAELLERLDHDSHPLAVEIASIPEDIRGYGHVKERHLRTARAKWDSLMAAWRGTRPRATAAE